MQVLIKKAECEYLGNNSGIPREILNRWRCRVVLFDETSAYTTARDNVNCERHYQHLHKNCECYDFHQRWGSMELQLP